MLRKDGGLDKNLVHIHNGMDTIQFGLYLYLITGLRGIAVQEVAFL